MQKIQIFRENSNTAINEANGRNGLGNVNCYSIYSEFREYEYIKRKVEDTQQMEPTEYKKHYLDAGRTKHYVNLGNLMKNENRFLVYK
jgi:hypothetical protein